jgi:hypothetical protein
MIACKACKKLFVPVVVEQKYCSKRCRNLKTPTAIAAYSKRACAYCGKEFSPKRKWQKFCNDKCQHDDSNKRNDIAQKMREFRQRRDVAE